MKKISLHYSIKNSLLFFAVMQMTSCSNEKEINELEMITTKIEAFNILEDNHDLLHLMLDEDKDKGYVAFDNFKKQLLKVNNIELIPINNALKRIKNFELEHENIRNIDELVDYYQSGLSIQIESIFRGYGVKRVIPSDSTLILYKKFFLNN
jgi:hypothetical protein